ncbi:MAG: holo-[acyl-carrier-protein] synthase [Deltaproteobacteria bacterium RIFCSPLOWO2_12_FULL_43_16]|nr:MAG: holo-[acyl-carrier-protein] synthase [Deltaproteobacteria bacterium GWA2_43_19]OGQ12178.1 MAG: holo-[acyl-carrier-protein] synthase [Deltaproteobacteria bacterium RIFCSPHIGHO2_02_FULL_43_33]OGQ59771.1 MAG: holo-[acyl-carrier-protein] synthase [Deltaproteobacteria bacterium RIFCSPLOWO2_12_FULL_43_16]HBR18223.1 holo-[acyl-carrier-protein] synthase [Deltaproteobacteria bacterium]
MKTSNGVCSTGIDIVYIPRLVKYINDEAFLDRLLTDVEREYIFTKKIPYKHLAGRFAAKEAVMKALGTGWDKGIGWRDIEVINTPDGRPAVRLHSKAKDIVQSKNIFLSISYAKDIAVACAVLEGANELSHSNPCL